MSESPAMSSRDKQSKPIEIESSSSSDEEDEDKRTLFCANLHEDVTEELLFELFLQAGPLETVRIPKDKDGRQRNFGFVTYQHACSVQFALSIFEDICLFRQKVVIRRRNGNSNGNKHGNSRDVDSGHRRGRHDDRDNRHFDRDRLKDQNFSLRGMANSHNQSRDDSNMYPTSDRHDNNWRGGNNHPQVDLFDPALIAQLTQNVMFGNDPSMRTRDYDDGSRKRSHSHRNNPYSRPDASSRNFHSQRSDRRSEQRNRHR